MSKIEILKAQHAAVQRFGNDLESELATFEEAGANAWGTIPEPLKKLVQHVRDNAKRLRYSKAGMEFLAELYGAKKAKDHLWKEREAVEASLVAHGMPSPCFEGYLNWLDVRMKVLHMLADSALVVQEQLGLVLAELPLFHHVTDATKPDALAAVRRFNDAIQFVQRHRLEDEEWEAPEPERASGAAYLVQVADHLKAAGDRLIVGMDRTRRADEQLPAAGLAKVQELLRQLTELVGTSAPLFEQPASPLPAEAPDLPFVPVDLFDSAIHRAVLAMLVHTVQALPDHQLREWAALFEQRAGFSLEWDNLRHFRNYVAANPVANVYTDAGLEALELLEELAIIPSPVAQQGTQDSPPIVFHYETGARLPDLAEVAMWITGREGAELGPAPAYSEPMSEVELARHVQGATSPAEDLPGADVRIEDGRLVFTTPPASEATLTAAGRAAVILGVLDRREVCPGCGSTDGFRTVIDGPNGEYSRTTCEACGHVGTPEDFAAPADVPEQLPEAAGGPPEFSEVACPFCPATGRFPTEEGDEGQLRVCSSCGYAGPEEEFEEVDHSARRCRKCGCTDDRACDEGCSWVEEDLCSACVPEEAPAPDAGAPAKDLPLIGRGDLTCFVCGGDDIDELNASGPVARCNGCGVEAWISVFKGLAAPVEGSNVWKLPAGAEIAEGAVEEAAAAEEIRRTSSPSSDFGVRVPDALPGPALHGRDYATDLQLRSVTYGDDAAGARWQLGQAVRIERSFLDAYQATGKKAEACKATAQSQGQTGTTIEAVADAFAAAGMTKRGGLTEEGQAYLVRLIEHLDGKKPEPQAPTAGEAPDPLRKIKPNGITDREWLELPLLEIIERDRVGKELAVLRLREAYFVGTEKAASVYNELKAEGLVYRNGPLHRGRHRLDFLRAVRTKPPIGDFVGDGPEHQITHSEPSPPQAPPAEVCAECRGYGNVENDAGEIIPCPSCQPPAGEEDACFNCEGAGFVDVTASNGGREETIRVPCPACKPKESTTTAVATVG